VTLHDGDLVELASVRLAFRSLQSSDRIPDDVHSTLRANEPTRIASVVGDVVSYTALTEHNGDSTMAAATDALFAALNELLVAHGGTISNYAGDSVFAAWDAAAVPDAPASAVRFAVAANELVVRRGAELTLRGPDDEPMRMGWGVTLGDAAAARPSPARPTVQGDAINLAFRLSGLAARAGEAPILVTAEAALAAPAAARYGELREVTVRGRAAPALVRAARPAA